MNAIEIAPSIISADLSCLADEVKRIEEAGADAIHIDVMDGHFVPNITIGPSVLCAVRRHTKLFLDVHLMIYNPYDYVEKFVQSGANSITFHFEATESVMDTIEFIRTCNCEVGLAINPDTSLELIEPYMAHIDRLLIMSVNPGFSGQSFIEESLEKVKHAKFLIEQCHKLSDKKTPLRLQVDGGVNDKTAKELLDLGADSLVSGSFLLSQKDLKGAISNLKSLRG